MFGSNRRAEEFAKLDIIDRLYVLQRAILEDALAPTHNNGYMVEPWASDKALAEEMLKEANRMKSDRFLSIYGGRLSDLERTYNT